MPVVARTQPAPQHTCGSRVGIHAAKRRPRSEELTPPIEQLLQEPFSGLRTMPLGAVVATATLVECLRIYGRRSVQRGWDVGRPDTVLLKLESNEGDRFDEFADDGFDDYSVGRWVWHLADVEELPEPIQCRGYRGLWKCQAL